MDEFQSPIHNSNFQSPISLFVEANTCVTCAAVSKSGRTLGEDWYCRSCWLEISQTPDFEELSSDEFTSQDLQVFSESEHLSDMDPTDALQPDVVVPNPPSFPRPMEKAGKCEIVKLIYKGSKDPFRNRTPTESSDAPSVGPDLVSELSEQLSVEEKPSANVEQSLSEILSDLAGQVDRVRNLHFILKEKHGAVLHEQIDPNPLISENDVNLQWDDQQDTYELKLERHENLQNHLKNMELVVNNLRSHEWLNPHDSSDDFQVQKVMESILDAVLANTKQSPEKWAFEDEELDLKPRWFSCSGRCHTHYLPSTALINRESWENYYCWCPKVDQEQWLQIKFPITHRISGIATQGRCRCDQYQQFVTEFRLEYLNSEDGWIKYPVLFTGNSDAQGIVCHNIDPIHTTGIRICPTKWEWHVALRVALFGKLEHHWTPPPDSSELANSLKDLANTNESNLFLQQHKQHNFETRNQMRSERRNQANQALQETKAAVYALKARVRPKIEIPKRAVFQYPPKEKIYMFSSIPEPFRWNRSKVRFEDHPYEAPNLKRFDTNLVFQEEICGQQQDNHFKGSHNLGAGAHYECGAEFEQTWEHMEVGEEYARVQKRKDDMAIMINYKNNVQRRNHKKELKNVFYHRSLQAEQLYESFNESFTISKNRQREGSNCFYSEVHAEWHKRPAPKASTLWEKEQSKTLSWKQSQRKKSNHFENLHFEGHDLAHHCLDSANESLRQEQLQNVDFGKVTAQDNMSFAKETWSHAQEMQKTPNDHMFIPKDEYTKTYESEMNLHEMPCLNFQHEDIGNAYDEFASRFSDPDLRNPHEPSDCSQANLAMEVERLRRLQEYHEVMDKLFSKNDTKLLRIFRKRKKLRQDKGPDWVFMAMIFRTSRAKVLHAIQVSHQTRMKSNILRNLKPSVTSGKIRKRAKQKFSRSLTLVSRTLKRTRQKWRSPSKMLPLSLDIYQSPPTEICSPKRRCKSKPGLRRVVRALTCNNMSDIRSPLEPLEDLVPLSMKSPLSPTDTVFTPPSVPLASPIKSSKIANPKDLLSPTMDAGMFDLECASSCRDLSSSPEHSEEVAEEVPESETTGPQKRLPEEHLQRLFTRLYNEKDRSPITEAKPEPKRVPASKADHLYNRLYEDHRRKMKRQYLKKQMEDVMRGVDSVKECTFKPEKLSSSKMKIRMQKSRKDMSIYDRLYSQGMLRKRRISKRNEDAVKEESTRFSFRPSISQKSQKLKLGSNVHRRLYEETQSRQEKLSELESEMADPELTFSPRINRRFNSSFQRKGKIEDRLSHWGVLVHRKIKAQEHELYPHVKDDEMPQPVKNIAKDTDKVWAGVRQASFESDAQPGFFSLLQSEEMPAS